MGAGGRETAASTRCAVLGDLLPMVHPPCSASHHAQAATFEKFKADLWTMSPPCQPFTRTGNQQHSDDPRSRSFLFLTGLLAKMECPPRYILLENVKGFDESATRDGFVKVLDDRG